MLRRGYYSLTKNFLKKPVHLIHFVTNKCNSNCSHCFYSKELNLQGKEDLTLEEIEGFSKQLGNLGWLLFSGGEPFIRKDIDDIYKTYLKNNNVHLFSCPTNGILTSRIVEKTETMLKMKKIKSFSINLSLDGLEETHNSIRGVKSFHKVLETYDELAKLKKKEPWLSIRVNTTLSNKNIREIEKLHEFVKERMPALNYHSFDILRGTPKDSDFRTPEIYEIEKVRPLIFKIWENYDFYGKKDMGSKIANNVTKRLFDISLNILKTDKQPFPCYAGKVNCVLDNNGDIMLCEMLPKVGNIRDNSFEEVWNSEEAKKQREMIKKRGCTCTHLCFQSTNYLLNLKHWPEILKF